MLSFQKKNANTSRESTQRYGSEAKNNRFDIWTITFFLYIYISINYTNTNIFQKTILYLFL